MNLSVFKGRTVLVTGNTGFKGSWLTMALLHFGAKVAGYSLPPDSGMGDFVRCGLARRIRHETNDVRNAEALAAVFRKFKPEFAFHLAAQPLVLESFLDPALTFETNVMGTVNFLEALRRTPSVRSAVVVTTDKVYENNEAGRPFRETDPLGGHDPYSASKAASEIAVASFNRSFFNSGKSCAVATARAGNVIGGGDWAKDRIVPDCMRALLSGKKIILRNPDSIRPWQYVLEPVYGYLLLASELWKKGRAFSGAWNFGPSYKNTFTVGTLVDKVMEKWGSSDSGKKNRKPRYQEARILKLDSTKAAKRLGWRPQLGFETTVRNTVEDYRKTVDKQCDLYRERTARIREYLHP